MSKKIILVSCVAVLVFSMCLNALQEDEMKRATAFLSGLQPRTGQQSIVNVLPPDVARSIVEMATTKKYGIEFEDWILQDKVFLKVRISDVSNFNDPKLLEDFQMYYDARYRDLNDYSISRRGAVKVVRLPKLDMRLSIYEKYEKDEKGHEVYPERYIGSIYLKPMSVSTVINNELKYIEDVPLDSIEKIKLYRDRAEIIVRGNKDPIRVEYFNSRR